MKTPQADTRYNNYDDIPLFLDANEIAKCLDSLDQTYTKCYAQNLFPRL